MATYGIIVKKSDGDVQIDGNYKNFALKQEGSTAVGGGDVATINFTDVSTPPIVALRPDTSKQVCFRKLTKSGGNFVSGEIFCDSGSFTQYWATFIAGAAAALPDYGLVIRNSSDDVIFHSDDKHLKIEGVYAGSLVRGNDTSNITVVDATNYFLLTDFSAGLDMGSPNWIYETRGVRKTGSTTIKLESFLCTVGSDIGLTLWTDAYQIIEISI